MKKDQFEQLYEEHAGPLLGFLVYRTGNRATAEEVLADTFERVLRSRSKFNPNRGKVKTWIYSIALNRLRDLHRRAEAEERALRKSEAGAPEAVADIDRFEERSTVASALERLDEMEREASRPHADTQPSPPLRQIAEDFERMQTVNNRMMAAVMGSSLPPDAGSTTRTYLQPL